MMDLIEDSNLRRSHSWLANAILEFTRETVGYKSLIPQSSPISHAGYHEIISATHIQTASFK